MPKTLRRIFLVGALVLGGCTAVKTHTYEKSQEEWRTAVPSSDLREPIDVGLGD